MRLSLCVGARDLSTSDAFATVCSGGEELGRTDVSASDSSNPEWEKVFVLDFDDIEGKAVTVGVCSGSDGSELGNASFELSTLLEKKVEGNAIKEGGFIFAYAAEHEVLGSLKLNICAKDLKNSDGFLGLSRDKSDPFFKIRGASGDDVYESDVLENNLNPNWSELEIQLKDLCDGDLNAPLTFVIYDYDPDNSDDFMGKFERSVNGLLSAASSDDAFDLNKNGKIAGSVLILMAELIDYVNPVDVGRAAIEAAAVALKSRAYFESTSEAAARALEKAETACAVADEKESHSQELAEELADAEKAAADAKDTAKEAADEADSQPVAGTLNFELKGKKLKNTEGLFRKPDPFFAIQKPSGESGEWDMVLTSDVIMNTLNPSWQEVQVELSALGNADLDGALRFVVFDKESDGKHELMGCFETSVNGLLSANEDNDEISMMKGGNETGTIIVAEAGLANYVDPSVNEKKLKELADKAEEARFFVMGRKAGAKVALDAAEKARNDAEELKKEADAAAEEARAAEVAADEAADNLAAVVS
mmetsp:Transcript_56261/g.168458  ORF Transcript_56261/g.168458 Transcript_56261/m.168458 type:complete len:536 (-) Transcript_56261:163-1770(-)